MSAKSSGFSRRWEAVARTVTEWSGKPFASAVAFLLIVAWAVTGPAFGFSDTWQLVINTATTIVTFLMVFIIQHTQNQDTRAMELKLNEIVAAVSGASNRLIDVEDLSSDELALLRRHYQELARMVTRDSSLTESHSIEEAAARHCVEEAAG